MHGHVTVRYLQYRTVDRRHVHSAYDNDECHVTAFRPISEAAHSWSYDNLTCRWTWKLDSNDVALSWLRASKMTQDFNSTRLPDQSALSFWSSAQLLHGRSAADVSPAYAALSVRCIRIVLLDIKGIYETSHNLHALAYMHVTWPLAATVQRVVLLSQCAATNRQYFGIDKYAVCFIFRHT